MSTINYDFYSVDASIMIKLKDMLPYDLFQPAWDEIGRLVSANRWKIFENVIDDVHGEWVRDWMQTHDAAIVKFDTKINAYINVLMVELEKQSMTLVDPVSLKNNTDPFVVMLALYLEERNLNNLKLKTCDKTCCLLTNEEPKPNKKNIP